MGYKRKQQGGFDRQGRVQEYIDNKDDYQKIYFRYFNYLYNLAITRFEWINLPEEILPSFIEDTLFWKGIGVFMKDEAIPEKPMYAFSNVNLGGDMDNYNIPNQRWSYTIHDIKELDKLNSVLVRDNMIGYPMCDFITMHAEAMTNLRLTRDINVFAQRTPVALGGTQDMKMTMKNFIDSYYKYIPFIPIKDTMDLDKIKAINMEAPFVADKIQALLKQEKASALCTLGIMSSDETKKERAITDEISANNEECALNRESALNLRKRACEQINRLWGLNVDVKFRMTEIININTIETNNPDNTKSEEGEENVNVYNEN